MGFTLIELLIVITIIGILAVALLPSVLGAPGRARDVQRKADLKNIVAALESFNSDNGRYPSGTLPDRIGGAGCLGAKSTADIAELEKYFQNQAIPKDPQGKNVAGCGTGGLYFYCRPISTAGYSYYIVSSMEIPGSGNVMATSLPVCTFSMPATTAPTIPSPKKGDEDAYVIIK